jgi:hypothetical protein
MYAIFSIDGNPEWRDAQRVQNKLDGTWRDDMYSYFYNRSEPRSESGKTLLKNTMPGELRETYDSLKKDFERLNKIYENMDENAMGREDVKTERDEAYAQMKHLEDLYFIEIPAPGPMNLNDFRDKVMPQYSGLSISSMPKAARDQLDKMYNGVPGENNEKVKEGYVDEWNAINSFYMTGRTKMSTAQKQAGVGMLVNEQEFNKWIGRQKDPIKALEDKIADIKRKYKTVAAEFPLKILEDRLAKERILELVRYENNENSSGRNVATRALFDILTLADNKQEDWHGSELISGKYSMISPSRLSEGVLQLNEIIIRERSRMVQVETKDLNDEFKEINQRIRKTGADLKELTYEEENKDGELIQYFYNKGSEGYMNIERRADNGDEAARAMLDFLDKHLEVEKRTGKYSWDAVEKAYRVPQVEADIMELLFGPMEDQSKKKIAKMLGQGQVIRTFKSRLAVASAMDDYYIDIKRAGISAEKYGLDNLSTYGDIKDAILQNMDQSGGVKAIRRNAQAIRDLQKVKNRAEELAAAGTDDLGAATTTQSLGKIKPKVGFVKTDTRTSNIAAAVSRHHQGMIFKNQFEGIAPILNYLEGHLERTGNKNMLRWLQLHNDNVLYGKQPESVLGKTEPYVNALASYTYATMLGLNFTGSIFNWLQGMIANYREIGLKNMYLGYKRMMEQIPSKNPTKAATANKAIKLMNMFDIVSVSKDVEMNISQKNINRLSNILYMNIVIPEYINHAMGFIGSMTSEEWSRIAPLVDAEVDRKQIVMALGGLEIGPNAIGLETMKKEELDRAYRAGLKRIDELQEITQRANGAYAKSSRRMVNNTSEGRAVMMFKNWVPELVLAHFSKETVDIYGYNRKGMFQSATNVVGALRKKQGWKELAWVARGNKPQERFQLLSEVDQTNIQKIIRESLALSAVVLAGIALYGDDDEEMTEQQQTLKNLMDRAISESLFVFDPDSYIKLVGAVPIVTTLENMWRTSRQLFMWETYESSNGFVEEGDFKIQHYVYKNIPYGNQFRSTLRTLSEISDN